jgi:hypothetical protein
MSKYGLDKSLVICLGFPKCATTWIHRQFEAHQQIAVTTTKEIDYWSNNYDKGKKWYLSQFTSDSNYTIYAEITPHYMHEEILTRLSEDLKDEVVKFMVCMRNPCDRTYSHYMDKLRSGERTASLHEMLVEGGEILDQSLYAEKLMLFNKHFQKNALKIFYYDDLKKDPVNFFYSICDYLEVEKMIENENAKKNYNAGRKANKFDMLLKKIEMKVKNLGLKRAHLQKIGLWNLIERLYTYLSNKRPMPEMTEEDRRIIEPFIKKDLENLRTMLPDVPRSW